MDLDQDGKNNEDKFFKDNYSDDFEDDDPQDATVIKKPSNPLNKSNQNLRSTPNELSKPNLSFEGVDG